MTAPNLAQPRSLIAKTAVLALTTSAQAVLNNAALSGKVLRIVSLYVANSDGANNADVTINLYSQDDLGGTATKLVNTVTVPADATLSVVSKEAPIYIAEDRSLVALASASGDLEIVCAYEEIG